MYMGISTENLLKRCEYNLKSSDDPIPGCQCLLATSPISSAVTDAVNKAVRLRKDETDSYEKDKKQYEQQKILHCKLLSTL